MGQKNAVTKRFCGDKIRFADLVNGLYFQGRNVIKPEELTDAGEVYAEPCEGDEEEKRKYLERNRDIKMRHTNGATMRILAIEDQHYIDYTMPFRNMQYDALEYQHQVVCSNYYLCEGIRNACLKNWKATKNIPI